MLIHLPNQKVSDKKRRAKKFENVRQTIEYYISEATFDSDTDSKARRIANGTITTEDYSHITKVYKNKELKKFQNDVKNIPLVQPILTLLVGEKRKSPFNYTTKVNNADSSNKYLDSLNEKISRNNQQAFVNGLNDLGYNTEVDSKPTQAPEEIKKLHDSTWRDKRAIAGQELLDDLVNNKDIRETFVQMYKKDWVQVGKSYLFPYVINDDVEYEDERPENVWVSYSNKSLYAEDGDVVIRRMKWNLSEFIATFNTELKEEKINGKNALDWLNDTNLIYNIKSANKTKQLDSVIWTDEDNNPNNSFDDAFTTGEITIYHTAYKTLQKYKILTYINSLGLVLEKEVDETYKIEHGLTKADWDARSYREQQSFIQDNLGADLYTTVQWTNQIWEGYCIPANDIESADGKTLINDLYLGIKPVDMQRRSINNHAKCKLPVIGRKDGYSIPNMLAEFQYQYNLIHLIEEQTLAKDGGSPVIFPIDLVPNMPSWGNTPGERLESMLYYRDVFNVIFFDGSNERITTLAQTMKSVNMSTLNTVIGFMEIKAAIKQNAWDALGINGGRWGETAPSEGKGKNEQNIMRSSLHTVDLNLSFNKIEERALLAYLDYSKYAFINGKTITKYPRRSDYILSEDTVNVFKLDVDQHIESDYGVQVASSGKDADTLQMIQQLMMPYAQNGISPDAVIGAIQTDNPIVAKDYLKEAHALQQQQQEQQAKQQQESEQQIAKMQQETQISSEDFVRELEYAKLKSKELIASMQEETKRMNDGTPNSPNNAGSEYLQQVKLDNDKDKINKDYNAKMAQISSNEKIAKQNNNNKK